MRQKLSGRLQQLERSAARRESVTRSVRDDEEAVSRVESFLGLMGLEQRPEESLAETLARALEISYNELATQIDEDMDPIHKYLNDRGVFQGTERTKAAGTRPSGSNWLR